jgi:hypothetical protein
MRTWSGGTDLDDSGGGEGERGVGETVDEGESGTGEVGSDAPLQAVQAHGRRLRRASHRRRRCRLGSREQWVIPSLCLGRTGATWGGTVCSF